MIHDLGKACVFMLALMFAAALSACVRPDPVYRPDLLRSDPRLVGRWMPAEALEAARERGQAADLPAWLGAMIEDREVIRDGRPRSDAEPDRSGEAASTGGYLITIPFGPGEGESVVLNALLIEYEGERFIAYPSARGELPAWQSWGLTLPLHRLCRVELEGDELRLWMLRGPAYCAEGVWVGVDPAEPTPRGPLPMLDERRILLTNHLEEFVRMNRAMSGVDPTKPDLRFRRWKL